jgi:tRNA (cmo5U34)-methyltransferase
VSAPQKPFTGAAAHSYADGPPRQVPGFHGLHRMAMLLLAERAPTAANILVLGAGGGLEIEALASAQPSWRFEGVDPSADMIAAAATRLAPVAERVCLVSGYIDSASDGPFDGATALLTFHFIPPAERVPTLAQLHRRLRPGAPLLIAHLSVPAAEPARTQWLMRHIAFGAPDGTEPAQLEKSAALLASRLTILSPEAEEAMLAEAGFTGAELFYAGFAIRGWVAYA